MNIGQISIKEEKDPALVEGNGVIKYRSGLLIRGVFLCVKVSD